MGNTKKIIERGRLVSSLFGTFAFVASLMISCSIAFAVTPTTNSKSIADATDAKKKPRSAATSKINSKSEKTALALVETHLPELSDLLRRLKKDNPRQYDLAIRDMVRSARRLEFAKNRDEELYEIEVEVLKAQSSVKLLAAKLKVRDKSSERELLRKAISRLHHAEIAKAKYNVRFYQDRAQKAQQLAESAKSRLKTIQETNESRLEKSFAAFLRDAGRQENKISRKSESEASTKKPKQ